jgi:hypothetical protein
MFVAFVTAGYELWGRGRTATVSRFWPVEAAKSVNKAFSTGIFVSSFPNGIYECAPHQLTAMEPRLYTCYNPNLGAMPTPEQIRDYGQPVPACDTATELANEVMHWGVWQHNCWDKRKALELHRDAYNDNPTDAETVEDVAYHANSMYYRKLVFTQHTAHIYNINCEIRDLWEKERRDIAQLEKDQRVQLAEDYKSNRDRQFWIDSFPLREKARELDALVPEYFMKLSKGENVRFDWAGLGPIHVDGAGL